MSDLWLYTRQDRMVFLIRAHSEVDARYIALTVCEIGTRLKDIHVYPVPLISQNVAEIGRIEAYG